MNYQLTVNGKTYTVEIEDINARPVIAVVDGERFEVNIENANHTQPAAPARVEKKNSPPTPPAIVTSAPKIAVSGNVLSAPLPGTVTEVFVKSGDKVEAGQVLLVIEAMKMKNSIRSTHSGTIQDVLVSAGQSVAHKQALVKFVELGEASWM